jgi:glyoxylase-like metal-dependent hydrolase (beta-lactamase superfamily II)
MSARRLLLAAGIAVLVAGCSSGPPSTRQLAQDAIDAMGGRQRLEAVRTIAMRDGEGTRYRLGQSVKAGDADQSGTLTQVAETVDLAGGRAALDYALRSPSGFQQSRKEVLTSKDGRLVGIETVPGRPVVATSPSGLFSWGSQNSPEFLLRRNVVSVVLAAADSGSGDPADERDLDGRSYRYGTATLNSEQIGLYFDPDSKLLAAFEATDTETMLGDVRALYVLEDYRSVDGLMLPHKIAIRKGDQPYSEVQFASIAINDPAADAVFDVPEDLDAEVDRVIAAGEHYSPVELVRVANGVHLVRAYSHNSLLVEFPNWLAVVEAPYTEAQSHALARLLGEQFPGKPIRYAAVTHHHFDHTGGVRGLAAHGATILVARGNDAEVRPVLEARHSNPPDELERRRQAGQQTGSVEVFDEKMVLSDGGQSLELYAITGNPHVDPVVIAYVPSARTLFQSDLFFPGTGAPASAAAVHLLQSVRALNLRVETHVGGHGGIAPFAELVKAAAAVPPTN